MSNSSSTEFNAISVDAWKKHPIYFVGLGVCLGIAFAMCWLAPAQQGQLRYEVEDSRREVAASRAQVQEVDKKLVGANTTLATLEKKIHDQGVELSLAQLAAGFPLGSPYPVGLTEIKIGDPITRITERFGPETINKTEETYWTVKVDHPWVRTITYYFCETDRLPRVSHLLIFLKNGSPLRDSDVLVAKLTDLLGQPVVDARKRDHTWTVNSDLAVTLSRFGPTIHSYVIMNPSQADRCTDKPTQPRQQKRQ